MTTALPTPVHRVTRTAADSTTLTGTWHIDGKFIADLTVSVFSGRVTLDGKPVGTVVAPTPTDWSRVDPDWLEAALDAGYVDEATVELWDNVETFVKVHAVRLLVAAGGY